MQGAVLLALICLRSGFRLPKKPSDYAKNPNSNFGFTTNSAGRAELPAAMY